MQRVNPNPAGCVPGLGPPVTAVTGFEARWAQLNDISATALEIAGYEDEDE